MLYVPRALRALVPQVPRALRAFVPRLPGVLRALVPYVRLCASESNLH